jgi:hypothetical protein
MAPTATDVAAIDGYDKLDVHRLVPTLRHRSQAELTQIDSYERSHEGRKPVLDKLRYLLNDEPIAGYDAMSADQVVAALASADVATLDAVRNYEMKLRVRGEVLAPVAELRRQAARSPGALEPEPEAVWGDGSRGGIVGGVTTVGLVALMVLAGILMLVSLVILGFLALVAFAPGLFGA